MTLLLDAAPQSSDFDEWALLIGIILALYLLSLLRPGARRRRRLERMERNVFRRPPL